MSARTWIAFVVAVCATGSAVRADSSGTSASELLATARHHLNARQLRPLFGIVSQTRSDRPTLLEYASLGHQSYASVAHYPPPTQDGTWILLQESGADRLGPTGETDSGLQWYLYERRTPSGRRERVLEFVGTEFRDQRDGSWDPRDAIEDFVQALGLFEPKQYGDALAIAARHAAQARADGVDFTLSGHSLGGGVAQFVAAALDLPAIVFNAAGLGPVTMSALRAKLATGSDARIINVYVEGELVRGLPGAQLGTEVALSPPPSQSPSAERSGLGGLARAYGLHSMESVMASLAEREQRLTNIGVDPAALQTATARETTIRAASMAAGPSGRIVLVGEGVQAEKHYLAAIARFGAANVRWVRAPARTKVGWVADDFRARVIVRVPSSATDAEALQLLAVGAETLDDLVATTYALAESMQSVSAAERRFHPMSGDWDSGLPEWSGWAKDLLGIAVALDRDMRSAQRGDLVLIESASVELMVDKAADLASSTMWSFYGQSPLLSGLAPGVSEFLSGAFRVSRDGRIDIDALTFLLDGLNKMAWGALGAQLCGGHVQCVQAYVNVGDGLAKRLRQSTAGMFEEVIRARAGIGSSELAQFLQAQRAVAVHGGRAREVGPGRAAIFLENGASQEEIDAANREIRSLNDSRTPSGTTREAVAASAPTIFGEDGCAQGGALDGAECDPMMAETVEPLCPDGGSGCVDGGDAVDECVGAECECHGDDCGGPPGSARHYSLSDPDPVVPDWELFDGRQRLETRPFHGRYDFAVIDAPAQPLPTESPIDLDHRVEILITR